MIVRLLFLASLFGCVSDSGSTSEFLVPDIEEVPIGFIADGFDFPVGPPDASGYYNAQGFGKNTHLGDDWNGVGGGNSDLGDPVYNIAHGKVIFAGDNGPSWGNVIRIVHYLPDSSVVESLYAHCDTMLVKEGDWIKRGIQIGTIGDADGYYHAHLHFEIRDDLSLPIGKGYSTKKEGYLDPTEFISEHRKL